MSEGKKSRHSSFPWYNDCVVQVQTWICQDCTTTKDNLHEKAENYAKNYLANKQELSSINRADVAKDVADVVEKALDKVSFDQRPPASVVAQQARNSIPEDPENRFIRLR